MITQDKASWQLGYSDGQAGHKGNEQVAGDKLAYVSGWIEGDATRKHPKKQKDKHSES